MLKFFRNQIFNHRPRGPTDKASDYESGDCRFESCQGQSFSHSASHRQLLMGLRYGLVVRIPGSHPGGPGSIPGNGNPFLNLMVDSLSVRVFPAWICFLHLPVKRLTKNVDEDGIRTHACRAHWISSPTP